MYKLASTVLSQTADALCVEQGRRVRREKNYHIQGKVSIARFEMTETVKPPDSPKDNIRHQTCIQDG